MAVFEGASMAHVAWAQFWPLWGLALAVPAVRAFALVRSFLGGR